MGNILNKTVAIKILYKETRVVKYNDINQYDKNNKESGGSSIYLKEIIIKLSHNLKVVGSNPTPATNK